MFAKFCRRSLAAYRSLACQPLPCAATITLLAALGLPPHFATAAVIFKAGTGGNLNATTSWYTTEAGPTNPGSIGSTDTLRFGGTGQGANIAGALLGGNLTVGAVRLDNVTGTPNYSVTIAAGDTLTLNGNADYIASNTGIVLNSGTGGSLTINADIDVAASQRWVTSRTLNIGGDVNVGANTLIFHSAGTAITTVSGDLSGTGAANVQFGASGGRVILQGTNTFSGQHQVSVGYLVFDSLGAENGNPRLNLNGGNLALGASFIGFSATVSELQGSGNIDPNWNAGAGTRTILVNQATNTVYSGVLLAGTSSRVLALTKDGAGTLDMTGVSTNSGPTNILGGTLRVSGSGLLGSGAITVGGGAELEVDTASGNKTFAQNIDGTGTIQKTSGNNFILQGTNTFSGLHQVDGGYLVFDAIGAENGNPRLNLNGGNLALGSAFAGNTATISELQGSGDIDPAFGGTTGTKTLLVNQATNTVYSGNILADNAGRIIALTKDGGGTLDLTGVSANSGPTNILGGTLRVSGGGLLGSGAITVGGGAELEVDTLSGNKTFGQNIGGTGTIQKTSSNNFILQGTNTFSGLHQVDGGYLVFDAIGAENGNPRLNLNGGNLALGSAFAGNTATISELQGSGDIDPKFGATMGTKTLLVNQATNTVYSGNMLADNAGRIIALTKDGAGTLQLTGTHANSGATTVEGGTLELAGGSLQNGQVNVNAGLFLHTAGTNNITGAVTVGNLTIASGAEYELNGGTLHFGDTDGAGAHHPTLGPPLTTESTLNIASGGTFDFNGGFLVDVTNIETNGGTFVQDGGNFVIGQQVTGAPPDFAAITTIFGGFTMNGGVLNLDIFGPELTPLNMSDAEPLDLLVVEGLANLNGLIDLDFEGGFAPSFGEIFTLVKADSFILGDNFGVSNGFVRVVPNGPNMGFSLQVIVPEPSTMAAWATAVLAAAGAWAARRRRALGTGRQAA